MDFDNKQLFPPLPLKEWQTLHLFVQIVTKIRMKKLTHPKI